MKYSKLEKILENSPKGKILAAEDFPHYAIIIPIAYIDSKWQFILEKRSKNIRQGGEISFPGGGFNKALDLSLKATAIRETIEVLGIKESKIKVIQEFDKIATYIYLESYIAFLDIKSLDELDVNTDEVEYAFSIPLEFFINQSPEEYFVKIKSISSENIDGECIEYLPVKDLNLPKFYKNNWDNGLRKIFLFKTEHGPLWGMTARMIISLLKNIDYNLLCELE